MAVSEAHKKASYKYNASRDSITIRPERSKGAAIRAAAVASGKSLQNYILEALDARMEQEGQPLADTAAKFILLLWYNVERVDAEKIQRTIDSLLKTLALVAVNNTADSGAAGGEEATQEDVAELFK